MSLTDSLRHWRQLFCSSPAGRRVLQRGTSRKTAPRRAAVVSQLSRLEQLEARALLSATYTHLLGGAVTPLDLATQLAGPGVTNISGVTYTGSLRAAGTFTGMDPTIGMTDGVILSTGRIVDAAGPNDDDATTGIFRLAPDSDLTSLLGGAHSLDAAALEFSFESTGGYLAFQVVFGSEEFLEYSPSDFNDIFAVFLDGSPDPLPVLSRTISDINTSDPTEFIDNSLAVGAPFDIEYDGFTAAGSLIYAAALPAGSHTIKFAIQDVWDSAYDSAILLQQIVSSDAPVDLELEKIAPDCVLVGDEATYALTVTNNSDQVATHLVVSDILPTDLAYVPGSLSVPGGTGSVAGNLLQALLPSLGARESVTITFRAIGTVSNPALLNTARVSSSNVELNPADNVSTSVTLVDSAPTLSPIPGDATICEDESYLFSFVVDDLETAPADLIVTVTSSDTTLLPGTGISLTGTGADRTVTLTPAADEFGTTLITISVDDGMCTPTVYTFLLTVDPSNDQPTFDLLIPTIDICEDEGPTIIPGVVDNVLAGPANESGQVLTFTLVSDHPEYFVDGPTMDASGNLSFTTAPDQYGSTVVTIVLSDDGGTDCNGVDTSLTVSLTINIEPKNDAPTFDLAASAVVVCEDDGPQLIAAFAQNISTGAANEFQSLTFFVSADDPSLFAVAPAIDAAGNLTFTPADDLFGTTTVTVYLQDDGGTDCNGEDTSLSVTFTIDIEPSNDVPSFDLSASNIITCFDQGVQVYADFATSISAGPANESGQSLQFLVTVLTNPQVFLVPPTIDPVTGLLTVVPSGELGVADISVVLMDDGGTLCNGVDQSLPQTFTISVIRPNTPPSFSINPSLSVFVSAGPQAVPGWAFNISPGINPEEAVQQVDFQVIDNSNPGLFLVEPTLSPDGTLSYTPGPLPGIATITVVLHDDGGTDCNGVDTSAPQQFTIRLVPQVLRFDFGTYFVDAPGFQVPQSQPGSTSSGLPVAFDFLGNDTEFDGNGNGDEAEDRGWVSQTQRNFQRVLPSHTYWSHIASPAWGPNAGFDGQGETYPGTELMSRSILGFGWDSRLEGSGRTNLRTQEPLLPNSNTNGLEELGRVPGGFDRPNLLDLADRRATNVERPLTVFPLLENPVIAPIANLLRDGAYDGPNTTGVRVNDHGERTFLVDVPNGTYIITVTMGDAQWARDNMRIIEWDVSNPAVPAKALDARGLSTPRGRFLQQSYLVTVDDGGIDLEFSDEGGDPFWEVNALVIRSVDALSVPSGLTISPPAGALAADGVTIDTFTLSYTAPPNADPNERVLLTVNTDLGQLVDITDSNGVQVSDVTTIMSGWQVSLGSGESVQLKIRRPLGIPNGSPQDAHITAYNLLNDALVEVVQTYQVPEFRRFDFFTSTSTATNLVSVRVNQRYSPQQGFGWAYNSLSIPSATDGTTLAGTVNTFKVNQLPRGVTSPLLSQFLVHVDPTKSYMVRLYFGDAFTTRGPVNVRAGYLQHNNGANSWELVPQTGLISLDAPPKQVRSFVLGGVSGISTDPQGLLSLEFSSINNAFWEQVNGFDIWAVGSPDPGDRLLPSPPAPTSRSMISAASSTPAQPATTPVITVTTSSQAPLSAATAPAINGIAAASSAALSTGTNSAASPIATSSVGGATTTSARILRPGITAPAVATSALDQVFQSLTRTPATSALLSSR